MFFKNVSLYVYAHLCPLSALGAPEGQRAFDPLELELQAGVSNLTWVLGI